jgi:hypothetical protein
MRWSKVSVGGWLLMAVAACSSQVPIGDVRKDGATTPGSGGAPGSGGMADSGDTAGSSGMGNAGEGGTSMRDAAVDSTIDAGADAAESSASDAGSKPPGMDGDGNASETSTTDGEAGIAIREGGLPDGRPTACEVVLSLVKGDSWIAFDSDRDNANRNLYMMHPDGTALTQLTKGTNDDREPFFSYDGTQLSYTSMIAGTPQIFIMDMRTRTSVQLTHRPQGADQSAFSRDGQWVSYRSAESAYVVKTDGTGEKVVARSVDAGQDGYWWPRFSGDGSELVVQALDIGTAAFKLDGTGFRSVAKGSWLASGPAISPSGRDVAAASGACGIAFGVWTSPVAVATYPCLELGRLVTPVDDFQSEQPSWGTDVVLAYRRTDRLTQRGLIAMVSRADNRACLLTSGPDDSAHPSWSQ